MCQQVFKFRESHLLLATMMCLTGVLANPAWGQSSQPSSASTGADAPKFQVEDLTVGEGEVITMNSWLTINYTAMLTDGSVFARTRPGYPFQFFFSEIMMEGWVQGLPGLRVDGKRRITMPPEYAYGNNPPSGSNVPPGATVIFEIECLQVLNLPEVKLGNGIQIKRLQEGEGEPAAYGDWVKFHVKVFAGETLRDCYDSEIALNGPLQVALPTPDGIFSGNTRGMSLGFPKLDMVLKGIKLGERREMKLASSRIIGPIGDPRLGVGADERVVFEFTCIKIDRPPSMLLNNGIRIEDVRIGEGRFAHMYTELEIRFKGTLEDGTVIESNMRDPKPLATKLYSNGIIGGMRLGLQGMREGGIRTLHVPARHAFGKTPPDQYAHVPPNSDVVYVIELLKVTSIQ